MEVTRWPRTRPQTAFGASTLAGAAAGLALVGGDRSCNSTVTASGHDQVDPRRTRRCRDDGSGRRGQRAAEVAADDSAR
jgi:hypothetical protein